MNKRLFDAFSQREKQVTEYMAGCGMKYGMDCTCGPDCRCRNCPLHEEEQKLRELGNYEPPPPFPPLRITSSHDFSTSHPALDMYNSAGNHNNQQKPASDLGFNSYGIGPAESSVPFNHDMTGMYSIIDTVTENQQQLTMNQDQVSPMLLGTNQQNALPPSQMQRRQSKLRNSSVLSYGNRNSIRDGNRGSVRGMSITSETTFGRAMSGLSALSIDWENLDDFDLDVDHSAHINQASSPNGGGGGVGRRTSATRRSILSTGSQDGGNGTQVSFKV